MARFTNLWSSWIAAAAALAFVSLVLLATNIDAGGTAYAWGIALAPLYVLVAAAMCAVCAVCVAHREALADDRDDALARERAVAFTDAAPAMAWSCVFLALVLTTLILVNVRADSHSAASLSTSLDTNSVSSNASGFVSDLSAPASNVSEHNASAAKRSFDVANNVTGVDNASVVAATTTNVDDDRRWTAAIVLALVVEFTVLVYCAAAACARQWTARHGKPPALWTRPIDAAVCCWTPGADYDDDSRSIPPPPHHVADETSDAPLYLYECGGSIVEHSPCCVSYGGVSSSSDGALVALGVVGCVMLAAVIIGTGLLVPFDDGRIEHRWPLFFPLWLVAPIVVALLAVVACRAGALSRHRYAQWSTLVALLFVVGVVATSVAVAATPASSDVSAHVLVAPLYAALALVATFHCCAAMVGARTGLLQARHDYHRGVAPLSTHVQEKLSAQRTGSFASPSIYLS